MCAHPHDDPHAALHAATKAHRAEHGCGAYTFDDGAGLVALVRRERPRRMLELGCALGYTACCLSEAGPLSHVDTIEGDAGHVALARAGIAARGLAERITVHHGWFEAVLPALPGPYDLAFFDGFAPSSEVVAALAARLRPGGLLVCANLGLAEGDEKARLEAALGDAGTWSREGSLEDGGTLVLRRRSAGTDKESAMLRLPDLEGKAVLITGASTGIGAALARAFAAQRAKVGLHYNASEGPARALAEEIAAAGGTVHAVKADMMDAAAIRACIAETAEVFGGLQGLINNAGGMVRRVPYAEATAADYDEIMDLNAKSVVIGCQAAIPHLKKQGGFIINTTSIAARNGASGGAGLYGSSKAFVSNVTRGMAKELIGFGIRVNAVAPGVIATPFHERYSTAEQLAAMQATIPQGRLGLAEDCVGAYLFLASAALSGYIIGQVIEVNGGQLMP